MERLEHDRRWAEARHKPVPLLLGDEIFVLADHAWGRYRFCLDARLGRIGITQSLHLPTIRVEPRAETLHSLGPRATVAAVREVLAPEVAAPVWPVSRLTSSATSRDGSCVRKTPGASSAGQMPAGPSRTGADSPASPSGPGGPTRSLRVSTTRQRTSPKRGRRGGPRSGVTGTARPTRSGASSSKSRATRSASRPLLSRRDPRRDRRSVDLPDP